MNKMSHPEQCDIDRPIALKQLICTAIDRNKGKICSKNTKTVGSNDIVFSNIMNNHQNEII
jgi:hypothetical protein